MGSEEIDRGNSGQVRRFMGVILEGEEIERGHTRWPKATHRGRRPPAREASVPPAGTRRRAAERLELLVINKKYCFLILFGRFTDLSSPSDGRRGVSTSVTFKRYC